MTPHSPPVTKRPAAQRDLLEHFVALGERAGEAPALRFLQAAEDTFAA
jgi:plasmid stabilization system protein ParE